MTKKSNKQQLKKDMLLIYGLVCWGDELWIPDNKNIMTMHHIKPVRNKGKLTWDNIALLSLYFHQFFNRIEQVDQKLADELNQLFRELNRNMKPPEEQHYRDVVFLTSKAADKHGIEMKR